MTDIIWQPDPEAMSESRIAHFTKFVEDRHHIELPTYRDLHRWSVTQLDEFWQAVWDFFSVSSTSEPGPPIADLRMPSTSWFPHARLNYVDHVLRHGNDDDIAIVGGGEPERRIRLLPGANYVDRLAPSHIPLRTMASDPGTV